MDKDSNNEEQLSRRPNKPTAKPVSRISDDSIPDIFLFSALSGESKNRDRGSEKKSLTILKYFNKKGKMIFAILAILLLLFITCKNTFKLHFATNQYTKSAFINTKKALSKELNVMRKNNIVLDSLFINLKNSNEQKIDFSFSGVGYTNLSFDAEIKNDRSNNQFAFLLNSPLLYSEFFLSDTKGIITFDRGNFYGFDTKDFGKNFKDYSVENNLIKNELLLNFIEKIDISYSNLQKSVNDLNVFQINPDNALLIKKYQDQIFKIFDYAKYNVSSEKLMLEDREVKTNLIQITISNESINIWGKETLKIIEKDIQLEEFLGSNSYEEIIFKLKNITDFSNTEIVFDLYIYKNQIIQIDCDEREGGLSFSVATTGRLYRLNHIELKARSPLVKLNVSAIGNHIGKGEFTSKILTKVNNISIPVINLVWDPDKKEDNFRVSVKSLATFEFTFANKNNGVIIKFNDFGLNNNLFSRLELDYSISKLKRKIITPKYYEDLFELTPKEIKAYFEIKP